MSLRELGTGEWSVVWNNQFRWRFEEEEPARKKYKRQHGAVGTGEVKLMHGEEVIEVYINHSLGVGRNTSRGFVQNVGPGLPGPEKHGGAGKWWKGYSGNKNMW